MKSSLNMKFLVHINFLIKGLKHRQGNQYKYYFRYCNIVFLQYNLPQSRNKLIHPKDILHSLIHNQYIYLIELSIFINNYKYLLPHINSSYMGLILEEHHHNKCICQFSFHIFQLNCNELLIHKLLDPKIFELIRLDNRHMNFNFQHNILSTHNCFRLHMQFHQWGLV